MNLVTNEISQIHVSSEGIFLKTSGERTRIEGDINVILIEPEEGCWSDYIASLEITPNQDG